VLTNELNRESNPLGSPALVLDAFGVGLPEGVVLKFTTDRGGGGIFATAVATLARVLSIHCRVFFSRIGKAEGCGPAIAPAFAPQLEVDLERDQLPKDRHASIRPAASVSNANAS